MSAILCDSCRQPLPVHLDDSDEVVTCPNCGNRASTHSEEWTGTMEYPANEAETAKPLTEFLAPKQEDDEIGRLGKYRILELLGRGGMGVVFRGEDPQLQRAVAIKAMLPAVAANPRAGKRFLREARAMAQIEHDNVVRVFQVGEDRGIPFLAMELLKGESLADRLRREPVRSVPDILRIGGEIALGLAAAHATGLIHRDIKPANIWLEAPLERVKLLDFGLARADVREDSVTQQGAVVGTPAYMSPEQGRGDDVDSRADLFSLGVVLYRMSTGQLPFQGKNAISTLLATATHSPAPPATLNPALPLTLSDLVMTLLAKEPEKRPNSAAKVNAALAELEARRDQPRIEEMKAANGAADATKRIHAKSSTNAGGKARSRMWIGAILTSVGLLCGAPFLLSKWNSPADPGTPDDPLPARYTNNLGMEFALVPKGKSWLAGGDGNVGWHEVNLPRDFYLGVYEVTQEEWLKVMGANPSTFQIVPGFASNELGRFPVDSVSWEDAQEFIKRVNEQARETGWTYRLPTEQEWEYACRGGPLIKREESAFDYYFEKPSLTLRKDQANFRSVTPIGRPCKVGSYASNTLGLFDMHGNIEEWCDDRLPPNAEMMPRRVVRGGHWLNDSMGCRAAHRYVHEPTFRYSRHGLRLARVIQPD